MDVSLGNCEAPLISKPYDWHVCMTEMAFTISKMSKDPSTKIGSVLVSPDKSKISFGYNGFPRGVPDISTIWNNREDGNEFNKYELVIHSEENAIMNAKCDVSGWSIYITHLPCLGCAKKIVQSGIKQVFYCHGQDKVKMNANLSKVSQLFEVTKVAFSQIPIGSLKFGI